MGKKRIVLKTEKELLEERGDIEKKLSKEVKVSSSRAREARVYISSTYNNTIITLTDPKGDVISWTSAGRIGFKGAKKSTPFAASKVAEAIYQVIEKTGIKRIYIYVKGIGAGRDSALRFLASKDLEIMSIKDVTPIPHNGCRPRKARRV